MHDFMQAQHAAEMVGLAVYGRAVLGRAVEDEPEVVSLRLSVTHQASGLSVIEWELVDRQGMALGGGGL